jgi:uncharacterized repeat protein (TIGR03803 family)
MPVRLLIAAIALFCTSLPATWDQSALRTGKKDRVLHAFQAGADGAGVMSGVIADALGNLYGTTFNGGTGPCLLFQQGCGTVFELSPPATKGGTWVETVLYSFQSGTDGAGPRGNLTLDKSGNLYGTTWEGGQNATCPGCGTVFELEPPSEPGGVWTERVLHRFTGDSGGGDGSAPNGGMTFDGGILYGTSYGGGAQGSGTVFQLSPPSVEGGDWTESVVHSFDQPANGSFPLSSLITDKTGNLYGTTQSGGTTEGTGWGTVFKLTRPANLGGTWNFSVLYRFKGPPTDAAGPASGLVFDELGNLYGTTTSGGSNGCEYAGGVQPCGAVFRLTPPSWTETVLYNFAGGGDGFDPVGGLALYNGTLYGTTVLGGGICPSGGCGTIFRLTPPGTGSTIWTETVLYRFLGGNDGEAPLSNLLFFNGAVLYGTTKSGGSSGTCTADGGYIGCGTVIKFVP